MNRFKILLNLASKILKRAKEDKITLRLFGGLAIWLHCPNYRYLLKERKFLDIDFAGYLQDIIKIQSLFTTLNFKENKYIMRLFGNQRRIFYLPQTDIYVDVVLDRLHFCHDINLKNRLEIDFPTIPLGDLLLSKLQIINLTPKDIVDIIVLILEHPLGDTETETINVKYITKLCSQDWGLWKTVTTNLKKIQKEVDIFLEENLLQEVVIKKIENIHKEIQNKKKTLKWKIRSLIGEKIKWYNEVEEVEFTNEELGRT